MSESSLLSVVVPLFNEAENVRPLHRAVVSALEEVSAWELIMVDDGSTDATADLAEEIAESDERVRVVKLARNYGQTSALQAGFDHAAGSVIVSMDGDLQNDPADIPRLVEKLKQGYDVVAGYRVRRKDDFIRRKVPSWIANRLITLVTGVPIRDNGCSLKAFRAEILDRLHLYSDMHRFIPAVAVATAGARVTQLPVRHHPRKRGTSKYGLSRIWKVLADLLTINMIRSFRERLLYMYGLAALLVGSFGVAFAAGGLLDRVTSGEAGSGLVLLGAALLMFGLSTYLVMLGLIGEVALRARHESRREVLPLIRENPA